MKFGRLRYNRKVNLVILYTILILSIINLAVYPGSRSKYIHSEPNALTYGATLYYQRDLTLLLLGTKDTNNQKYLSDYKTAYFEFEFEKNKTISTNGIDKYTIIPSSACSIAEITTNASVNGNSIEYEPNYSGDVKNTVILKCDVDSIIKDTTPKKTISVSVSIEENVNNETLNYNSGTYTDYLDNYYAKYPVSSMGIEELNWTNNKLTLPNYISQEFFTGDIKTNLDSVPVNPKLTTYLPSNFDYSSIKNIDDILKTWLEYIAISDSNKYGNEILKYVTKNSSITSSIVSMPGLDVSHLQTDKGIIHEFTVKENLVGYARTANQNIVNYMYFSTMDMKVMDEAFKYYLDNYTYLNGLSKSEKELLINYTKSFDPNKTNGIGYILTNGKIVNDGIEGTIVLNGQVVGGMLYNDGQLDLYNALSYANIKVNRIIKITNGYPSDMLQAIEYGLYEIYGNIISSDTIDSITEVGNPVRESMLRNNTYDGGNSRNSETNIVYDKNYGYLAITVSYDEHETCVTVSKLEDEISVTTNKLIVPEYYLTEELYNNYGLTGDNRSLYGIFKEVWLKNEVVKHTDSDPFYDYKSYDNKILDYILEKYPNLESIKNANNSLKGLKITKTAIDNSNIYVYEFELENLIGYIKTKDNTDLDYMYFSTTDMKVLNEAFEYYLDNYKYIKEGLSESEIKLIKAYAKSFDSINGIGYILTNGEIVNDDIEGTIVLDGQVVGGIYYVDGRLDIHDVLSYANIKVNKEMKITNAYPSDMLTAYEYGLRAIYGNIISDKTIEEITAYYFDPSIMNMNGHDIVKCIIGDSSGQIEAYEAKTFKVTDVTYGWNLLIKVSSDGTYTYVTVQKESATYSLNFEETYSEQESEVNKDEVDFESYNLNIEEVSETESDIDPKGSLVLDTNLDLTEEDLVKDNDNIITEDEIDSSDVVSNTSFEDINNSLDVEVSEEPISNVFSNGIDCISEINTVVNLF